MVYRDTLIAATGCSHLQLMMGRHIHTTLSTLSTALQPRWPNPDLVRQKDFDTKLSYRRNYDRHHEVCPLSPGDTVRVRTDNEKSWTNTGVITNRADTPRSYTVQTESDMYRRNRRHLSVVPLSPIKLPPRYWQSVSTESCVDRDCNWRSATEPVSSVRQSSAATISQVDN